MSAFIILSTMPFLLWIMFPHTMRALCYWPARIGATRRAALMRKIRCLLGKHDGDWENVYYGKDVFIKRRRLRGNIVDRT